MPFYEYETIPSKDGDPVKRYEFKQCMSDEPYQKHPETGEPIRRVYSTFGVGGSSPSESCDCGGDSCGCGGGHHHHGGGCSCGCCS